MLRDGASAASVPVGADSRDAAVSSVQLFALTGLSDGFYTLIWCMENSMSWSLMLSFSNFPSLPSTMYGPFHFWNFSRKTSTRVPGPTSSSAVLRSRSGSDFLSRACATGLTKSARASAMACQRSR